MAENLASILISKVETDKDLAEYRKRVAWVRANMSGYLPETQLSSNEKRRVLQQMSIVPARGLAFADAPIAKIKVDLWQPELLLLARKLMLAFHYMQFGQPLGRGGAIWVDVKMNTDTFTESWFRTFADMTMQNMLMPMRSKEPLIDQFKVQWTAEAEHMIGLYLATLQNTIVFCGITSENASKLETVPEDQIFAPFEWANPS